MKKLKERFSALLEKYYSGDLFSYKEIYGMWSPLILDAFFINAIAMISTSLVSSSGEDSIAAVSMINPLGALLICGFSALSTGGTVVVAQYKGKGDDEDVSRASGQTIMSTMLITILVSLPFIIFASPITHFFYSGAEEKVLAKAAIYLIGIGISMIPYAFYTAVFGIFRGLGETKLCLNLTLYINISFFLLSILFINVMKMDVMGSALAYIIARAFGAVIAAIYLFGTRKEIAKVKLKHVLGFDTKVIGSILKISLPFGFEQFVLQGGSLLVQKYMVVLGTEMIAANAIANSVLMIIYALPQSVGNLVAAVIGRCIGAGRNDEARKYEKSLLGLGTVSLAVSIVVFLPMMPLILPVYNPSELITPIIYRIMIIAVIPMVFIWPQSTITPNILRSAGDSAYASIISLVGMWIFRVGAGYVAAVPLGFGITGFWVCMVAEWLFRAVLYGIRLKGDKWLLQKTI
ncbi:MAG: MATE family efflux transporter [Lachnospiraceae bacterium]|nr:MATE family efflux transporter [Lachnospiraceae bacterium]